MTAPTREQLRELLLAWQAGQKTAREVHEEAENLMAVHGWKDVPRTEYASIQYEVLCQLDILDQQLITVDDIPAFLEFLVTSKGAEPEAWRKWEEYWMSLDLDARREMLRGDGYYAV